MNSHQIFSWKRFTALVRKELVEKRQVIVLTLASIFLVYLILFSMGGHIRLKEEFRAFYFIYITYGYLITACLVPSLAFNKLTNKKRSVELFSVPASLTEKFAARFLIYVIGTIVAFCVCVQLADLVRYLLVDGSNPPNNLLYTIKRVGTSYGITFPNSTKLYYSLYWTTALGLPLLFLLGGILWPRWSAFKTLLAVFAMNFIETEAFELVQSARGIALEPIVYANDGYLGYISVVTIIEMILCIVLAWYLFKRKNIVLLKWWE